PLPLREPLDHSRPALVPVTPSGTALDQIPQLRGHPLDPGPAPERRSADTLRVEQTQALLVCGQLGERVSVPFGGYELLRALVPQPRRLRCLLVEGPWGASGHELPHVLPGR